MHIPGTVASYCWTRQICLDIFKLSGWWSQSPDWLKDMTSDISLWHLWWPRFTSLVRSHRAQASQNPLFFASGDSRQAGRGKYVIIMCQEMSNLDWGWLSGVIRPQGRSDPSWLSRSRRGGILQPSHWYPLRYEVKLSSFCCSCKIFFNLRGLQGWPKLWVQVYHQDTFGR